jgi:hypothetical protein
MKRALTVGLISAALAAAVSLSAAADKPNLSGRWQLGRDYIDIDHRDPILIVQAAGTTRFLSTDGVARTDVLRTTARWNGQAIDVQTTDPAGVERFELSADGTRLILTANDKPQTYQRADLRAGVATVDVTPSAFLPMYGYANRKCGPANGVHDPLMAKAVVLESGPVRVAIVSLDLGSFVGARFVADLKQTFNLDAVLISTTHTHSGPQFVPSSSAPTSALGPTDTGGAAYLADLQGKVVELVRRASASMFAARLHTGRGEIALGYNRLLPREHGRSRALFDNLERRPLGPLDSEFQVLEVRDAAADAPRAVLVHYGVHSVVLGPTNCKYSADFPGAMQAAIEKAVPGAQAMYIQGGAGDVNPIFQGRTGQEKEDFALVARLGELLAGEVLKVRSTLRAIAMPSLPIRARSELLTFKDRWDATRTHDVGISTIAIGREIAIAALPGEPLHRLQTRWKHEADAVFPLFYGYTYSAGGVWPGYLPDIRSAAQGGYGADSTSTRVEIGAGERIIDRHLIHLYDLRGMWRAQAGPS